MSAAKGGPQGAAAQGGARGDVEGVDLSDEARATGAERLEKTERELRFILDIPMEVTVVLGRTKMPVNDVIRLGQGAVVELDKLAGEPMEVMVNNRLLARGEVVVINQRFGVRLTDVVDPRDRVKSLGE
ncbi:MAG: flagellar motor switch protein FliN [Myxococcales bacterium]|nr:flagellar motor switch protein FliN [Myxococcales bacterium]